MKKLIFLAIVSLLMASGLMAQNDNYNLNKKSVVIQTIDTLNNTKITNIEYRLTSFYNANRSSQFMIFAGAIITIAGVYFYAPINDGINPFPIVGSVCTLVGGVLYLDSFKFLNMNKKRKVKKPISDFY